MQVEWWYISLIVSTLELVISGEGQSSEMAEDLWFFISLFYEKKKKEGPGALTTISKWVHFLWKVCFNLTINIYYFFSHLLHHRLTAAQPFYFVSSEGVKERGIRTCFCRLECQKKFRFRLFSPYNHHFANSNLI